MKSIFEQLGGTYREKMGSRFFESCEGIYFLRGCARRIDRRERKATPKGVFGRTRRQTARDLGKP